MTAERLLRCSEPECLVEIVLMQPHGRGWHRHIGGTLHELRPVFPGDGGGSMGRRSSGRAARTGDARG